LTFVSSYEGSSYEDTEVSLPGDSGSLVEESDGGLGSEDDEEDEEEDEDLLVNLLNQKANRSLKRKKQDGSDDENGEEKQPIKKIKVKPLKSVPEASHGQRGAAKGSSRTNNALLQYLDAFSKDSYVQMENILNKQFENDRKVREAEHQHAIQKEITLLEIKIKAEQTAREADYAHKERLAVIKASRQVQGYNPPVFTTATPPTSSYTDIEYNQKVSQFLGLNNEEHNEE
jgi:hypothetical protein